MPTGADPSPPARVASLPLRSLRACGFILGVLVGGFCVLLLAVRYVALPRVDAHRDDIAHWLSGQLGAQVEIAAIRTGWDGWNPLIVVSGLKVTEQGAREGAPPAIELPEVAGLVSWTSLLAFEPRLKELTIDRPTLAVRRSADRRLHVAGLAIDPEAIETDSSVADWVMRQRLIVVRDGLVIWEDAYRSAPQLILDRVQFRLENGFGRHRFALTGTPPPEVAAPIDLRGDLRGRSFEDLGSASGRIYLRLDYADMGVWAEWLPLPIPVEKGAGAMRLWLEFVDGVPVDVVADVELADVRAKLASDLPALDLAHLAGRLTWSSDANARAFGTRGLWFLAPDGERIVPTDLALRYELDATGQVQRGRFVANHLELGPLAQIASRLPLPQKLRDDLQQTQPRGTLTESEYRWEGDAGAPSRFQAKGTLIDADLRTRGPWPGVAGLSGSFDANELRGSARIASRDVELHLPGVLAGPVTLDTASARMRWEHRGEALEVGLEDGEAENPAAAVRFSAQWRSTREGPGVLDLDARFTRADVAAIHRYLPLGISTATRDWVRTSLLKGSVDEGRITVNGDLSRFPFADGKAGSFVVSGHVKDGVLDYADGWPQVTGLDADVRFEGSRMAITAARGRILGAVVGRTAVTIADLIPEVPLLVIEGEASGPTGEFLGFVTQSPVANLIDRATEEVQATGAARLALKFELPLDPGRLKARVWGDLALSDNQVRWPGVPPLEHVSGRIALSEHGVETRDMALEVLGGPAKVTVSSRDGALRLAASGNANLSLVKATYPVPLADRIAGNTDWQLDLTSREGVATWSLASSLKGVGIDLPAPLGKGASETRALRVERRVLPGGKRELLRVDYHDVGRATTLRALGSGKPEAEGTLLLLGKAAPSEALPEGKGLTIRGDIASVDVDSWITFARAPVGIAAGAAPGATGGSAAGTTANVREDDVLDLASIDLVSPALVVFGRRLDAATLSARRANEQWRIRLTSQQAEGTANWEPSSLRHANGRLVARLSRLVMDSSSEVKPAPGPVAEAPRSAGSANSWPELEVTAEHFHLRGSDVGRMEFVARPEGTEWRVARFAIGNEAGKIDAHGTWRLLGTREETRFEVAVETRDSSAFLARFDLPDEVKGAPGRLSGSLAWSGSPADFEYPALSGSFRVEVGAGQFTKLDPGVGKLLGVLSLQALPRRITLDFRDVFSEGFAFDTINGNARITRGVLHTDDLVLSGPAARVTLVGDVDLEHETQRLIVRVQPALSSVVSTGAGAAAVVMLAANPLIGAAVGAGTLLAQKLMKDPIEQMFSYEYSVRGSWSEPLVERVAASSARAGGAAAPGPESAPPTGDGLPSGAAAAAPPRAGAVP